MDSPLEKVLRAAWSVGTGKFLVISGIALTLYDSLLLLDDEIRYVWRGRKTWISYFYIFNRILLVLEQFSHIYYYNAPSYPENYCLVRYYFRGVIMKYLVFSSEIFITLRIYAITLKNKIFLAYFLTMAFTRLAVWLASSFYIRPLIVGFPPLPIDAFNQCGIVLQEKFRVVPVAMGTAFDASAFLVVVWCTYRMGASALIRTIAADVTRYFLVMVAIQIYIQIVYLLMSGIPTLVAIIAYGIVNPILTLRFALSLKRAADSRGGQEWQLRHFSTMDFAVSPSDPQASAVSEDIEMDTTDSLDRRSKDPRTTKGVPGTTATDFSA